MLTENQAQEIVEASLTKTAGKGVAPVGSLQDAGLNEEKLIALVKTLVDDPTNGVPRFQHLLDPNIIGGLSLGTTIEELTHKVLELSAGKLCSNPSTPHPQYCCPYPTNCPQCGYQVL
jgi:hypothetical protein